MNNNLRETLLQLNRYLKAFSESGFHAESAEAVLSLLEKEDASPLSRVTLRFCTDRFERGTVILGLLISVSAGAARLVSGLCGTRPGYFTPSLTAALFFGAGDILPFAESLEDDAPLERLMQGAAPYYDAPMRLREYVGEYLLGGTVFDRSFLPREDGDNEQVPLQGQSDAEKELLSFIENSDPSQPFILRLTGQPGSGRHTCVRRVMEKLRRLYVPVCLSGDMSGEAIRELSVKLLLLDAVPVVSALKEDERFTEHLRLLADETGLVIAVTESSLPQGVHGVDTIGVRLNRPTLSESCLLWKHLSRIYPVAEDVDFAELSGEFEMTPGAVKKALRCAAALSGGSMLTAAAIKNGCYRSFDADMGEKAVRIEPVFTWDDIVLPEQSKRLLQDACRQVRLRHQVLDEWGFARRMPYGKGVSMIFTGPPGTGKTMAAQVMAAELGMEIYKVNLAGVVSKYIGETEKNLNEIFEKAKLCKCILFFDEADVLFSKRTEVKEANDKYSNMESAFLLQKTEEYNGVVILATNLVQNFDEAFKRRMRFIVDFPFPDAARRREMWKKAFPEKAPVDYIDFDFLVERFEFSGSNIRNIALHSAFLAAADTGAIGMKHIMEAIRNEYAKSGKAFTRAEAGEYYFEMK